MNLNEYIKQTEEAFTKEFIKGKPDGFTESAWMDEYNEIQAFIKTRIERGVELARQEAIDVVREVEKEHGNCGCCSPLVYFSVIKKLEEMKED